MTHVTCRLTAKNRDQLRNPTLGSQVCATLFNITDHAVSVFIVYERVHTAMKDCAVVSVAIVDSFIESFARQTSSYLDHSYSY